MTPAFREGQRLGRCGAKVLRPIGQAGKLPNSGKSVRGHSPGESAGRLYLPKVWADDPDRRAIAGVPDGVRFQTKPEIALQQTRQALADGVPSGMALMDPAAHWPWDGAPCPSGSESLGRRQQRPHFGRVASALDGEDESFQI